VSCDITEEVVGPKAIERAIDIYQQFRDRDQCSLNQARKVLTQHVFELVDQGERDEQKLTVSGLTHLKSIERERQLKTKAQWK
jgi:hypothetical protein